MKRYVCITLCSVIAVMVLVAAYLKWDEVTFVKRAIRHYTHIQNITLLDKKQNNHEWYGKAQISQNDGRHLLALYPWKHGFRKEKALAGKFYESYPPDCSACLYYIDDTGRGMYGYVVLVLSPDMQQIDVSEQFGD